MSLSCRLRVCVWNIAFGGHSLATRERIADVEKK